MKKYIIYTMPLYLLNNLTVIIYNRLVLLSLLLTIYNFCTNLKVHQLEYAIARDG